MDETPRSDCDATGFYLTFVVLVLALRVVESRVAGLQALRTGAERDPHPSSPFSPLPSFLLSFPLPSRAQTRNRRYVEQLPWTREHHSHQSQAQESPHSTRAGQEGQRQARPPEHGGRVFAVLQRSSAHHARRRTTSRTAAPNHCWVSCPVPSALHVWMVFLGKLCVPSLVHVAPVAQLLPVFAQLLLMAAALRDALLSLRQPVQARPSRQRRRGGEGSEEGRREEEGGPCWVGPGGSSPRKKCSGPGEGGLGGGQHVAFFSFPDPFSHICSIFSGLFVNLCWWFGCSAFPKRCKTPIWSSLDLLRSSGGPRRPGEGGRRQAGAGGDCLREGGPGEGGCGLTKRGLTNKIGLKNICPGLKSTWSKWPLAFKKLA